MAWTFQSWKKKIILSFANLLLGPALYIRTGIRLSLYCHHLYQTRALSVVLVSAGLATGMETQIATTSIRIIIGSISTQAEIP